MAPLRALGLRHQLLRVLLLAALPCLSAAGAASLAPTCLRVEHLEAPLEVEASAPRLTWTLEATKPGLRSLRQVAFRVLVATSAEALSRDDGDLWDSGKVASSETALVPYAGKPLASRQACHWKVMVWDQDGVPSAWSPPGRWAMGLLLPGDWTARWISFRDASPVHADRGALALPPPRRYRQVFGLERGALPRRATVYASALGNYRLRLNGGEVSDAWLLPGWSDTRARSLYRAFDLTARLRPGENILEAEVSEGWYAGYVGYGLLVGYGANRAGKNFYGKTPALLAQLELEGVDGRRATIGTDSTWQVTADGPTREADIIMGEAYDARREDPSTWTWEPAILAEENGSVPATTHDTRGPRDVELGFVPPRALRAHPGPPVRPIEELRARSVSEPEPGVFVFDLGENLAGVARLRVKGAAGTRLQLRYGERLHPDGRLMTENLRRARATDFYTMRGDPDGETWTPRFTYHGFQYVELRGLSAEPGVDAIEGVVLSSDTPYTGSFACSDEVLTRFWRNTVRTQKANFMDIPTDCPQRDERLGWMGDAQAYVLTASYNADVAAFFTKWLEDVREAQLPFGAYPDYCPYPMSHGAPGATHGAGWTDAGVIVPWTLWRVYGDRRLLEEHWSSMTRFLDWRARSDPQLVGVKLGNTWGDWLNVGEETPIELVDIAYHAYVSRLMAEMAGALGKDDQAAAYTARHRRIRESFARRWVDANGEPVVKTQTAALLGLWAGLLEGEAARATVAFLARRIEAAGSRMTTGFLGTKVILPVLSQAGLHGLACRLFQSRRFPSWGYEVENGATSVWERWDSFTREHGFQGSSGQQNASMNSFSHYAFGAVMEWAYRDLVGIDTDGPGYREIILRPRPPPRGATMEPGAAPLTWARAEHRTIRGVVRSAWRCEGDRLEVEVSLPPNTTARLYLPCEGITEGGRAAPEASGVRLGAETPAGREVELGSGEYRFVGAMEAGTR